MVRGRPARLRLGQLPSRVCSCGGRGARDGARGHCASTRPIREAHRYPKEALVAQVKWKLFYFLQRVPCLSFKYAGRTEVVTLPFETLRMRIKSHLQFEVLVLRLVLGLNMVKLMLQ